MTWDPVSLATQFGMGKGVTNNDHREKMKDLDHEKVRFPSSVVEQYRANEITSSGGV